MKAANKKRKTNKKRLAAGAAAVTAGAVLTGSLFSGPADLLQDKEYVPVEDALLDEAEDENTGTEEEEQEKRGLRARLRRLLLQLPLAVRCTVVLPLWALGWVLLSGISLASPVLAPAARTALNFLGLSAAALGAAAAGAKAMFPSLPLKKLFRPRLWLSALVILALLSLADALLPLVWQDWPQLTHWVRAASALLLSGGLLALLARRGKRLAPIPDAAPEEESQEEALRRVLEMADSAR